LTRKRKGKASILGNIRGVGTFAILILVMFSLLIFVALYGADFGFTTPMGTSLIQVIPPVFLITLSFWVIKDSQNPLFIGGAFMFLGISMAYLLQILYDHDVVNDAILFPGTLAQAMIIIVVACTILGGAVAISKR